MHSQTGLVFMEKTCSPKTENYLSICKGHYKMRNKVLLGLQLNLLSTKFLLGPFFVLQSLKHFIHVSHTGK